MQTRFQGERDLITYAPYRVGDRVVRCGTCRAVIKTEFVSNSCPLCRHTPFLPSPVTSPQKSVIISENTRSLTTFLWLLLLSVLAAYIPLSFPGISDFLCEASFGIELEQVLLCVGLIGLATAIGLYCNSNCRRMWQTSSNGTLLVLVPASSPYLVLAAMWAIIVIACFGLIVGIVASLFE